LLKLANKHLLNNGPEKGKPKKKEKISSWGGGEGGCPYARGMDYADWKKKKTMAPGSSENQEEKKPKEESLKKA